MNNKPSLGSKVLTIGFCTLLVLMTVAAFVYLLVGPDFLTPDEYQQLYGTNAPQPTGPSNPTIDYEALLYEANMQDLLDYLQELGYIDQENLIPMSPIGTDNWICDGLNLIWWDVENLVEGTEAYDYWQEYQENGFIIFGGTVYTPTQNGPFAVKVLDKFAGNEKQLLEDYTNFGKYLYEKNGGGASVDLSAEYEKALWNGTLEDIFEYLEEKGYIEPDTKQLLTTIGTENWVINGLEIMWWDVDNLVEGTEPYDYWNEFEENGFIIFGGSVYAPTRYGPYAIWVGSKFEGDSNQLTADMQALGQYLYEKYGGSQDLSAEYEKALANATMDDLLLYLEERGHIEADTKQRLTTVGTENWVVNNIELQWWDVNNLVEGTQVYNYWQEYQQNGFIILDGSVYAPSCYGSFAVQLQADFDGDADRLKADMEAFGQYLYEKNAG